MPLRSLTALLIGAVITAMCGQNLNAQEQLPQSWGPPDGILELQTDWNWFETTYNADLEELSPNRRANRGFFGSMDRMHLFVNRAETEQSYTKGDFGWGTRYDFGWMGNNDKGVTATYWKLGGPNVFEEDVQSRANVINLDDPSLPNVDPMMSPEIDQFGQLLPRRDRNNRDFNERIYLLRDSLNVIQIHGFELNRTWRLPAYRLGGILEPLAGVRYIKLRDTNLVDNYVVGSGTLVNDQGQLVQLLRENLTSNFDYNDNQMFGGQLGFRYFRYWRRFLCSCDFRGFALQNWQCATDLQRSIDTFYADTLPGTIDGDVVYEDTTETIVYRNGHEFVFGFDARIESAFQLTKAISIRGGIQVIDFARGILRGPIAGGAGGSLDGTGANTDQNVWIAGYSFGITVNR